MKNILSKSDFLKYLQCPKYFWLYKNKRSVLEEKPLDEFAQQIIDQGKEVELWAQKLFPEGVAVTSRNQQAVIDTKQLLESGEKTIFQATFQADGFYAMIDVLTWNKSQKHWIINEVKGTTSKDKKKEEHYSDACFQKLVMEKCGFKVGLVNLIELDKEFVKNGAIKAQKLLKITDISSEIEEISGNIEIQMGDAMRIMKNTEEPRVCDCIYKSRGNQCPAFSYCHPQVPEYSVHDICRIGASKKKLREIIDNDWFEITDIPLDFKLSKTQQPQVRATITKEVHIDTKKIRTDLEKIEFPIYFLDYETYPSAIPVFDGCSPFQQVSFQYSLHILREPNGVLEHKEFLHTKNSNSMKDLAYSLRADMGDTGSVIVWNKSFEGGRNDELAILCPELSDFLQGVNNRFYDLEDIFRAQYYVHKDLKGKTSIKFVLPVLCPELSYKDLNIQNGGMACNSWKKMIFEIEDPKEQKQIAQNLLEYCKLDTFAMVRIWEEVEKF